MNDDQSPEILEFWSDLGKHSEYLDPIGGFVSPEFVLRFHHHLERLQPLADNGNDHARYAIAVVFLLELIYDNDETRSRRIENDQIAMTELLCQCAENGLATAFDNLVTRGVGEIGRSARQAASDYEREHLPMRNISNDHPVYTTEWMAGAMGLWRARRCRGS